VPEARALELRARARATAGPMKAAAGRILAQWRAQQVADLEAPPVARPTRQAQPVPPA
jgi:hypothetical protein